MESSAWWQFSCTLRWQFSCPPRLDKFRPSEHGTPASTSNGGPKAKGPTLREPTSAETASYGDSAFERGNAILEREQVEYRWAIANAKTGSIQFSVPSEMAVKEGKTVLVRIYGPTAPEQEKRDFKATGSGSLKVITPMLVTLSQPDNPGSFKIEEDPKEAGNQFLPDDSFAEWSWTVTPLKPAEAKNKLRITAYLVFNEKLPNGSPIQVQVSSYTATVAVNVQPRWERFKDWISENWKDVLKYLIPTGAGSVFIVWLIAKLAGKSNKPEEKEKEKEKEPEEDDDDDDPV